MTATSPASFPVRLTGELLGEAFMASKTLLSAIELELFTHVGGQAMNADQIRRKVDLHPRAIPDFPDTLLALGMLKRDGEGAEAQYSNTPETAAFLDKASPTYIGGVLEMCNARLYGYWGDLTEGLRTGEPQNEVKHTGRAMFEELYSEPSRLAGFMNAMTGASMSGFHALADKFEFSPYRTLCDVGGATGQLSVIVAQRHKHMRCTPSTWPSSNLLRRRWNAHAAYPNSGPAQAAVDCWELSGHSYDFTDPFRVRAALPTQPSLSLSVPSACTSACDRATSPRLAGTLAVNAGPAQIPSSDPTPNRRGGPEPGIRSPHSSGPR